MVSPCGTAIVSSTVQRPRVQLQHDVNGEIHLARDSCTAAMTSTEERCGDLVCRVNANTPPNSSSNFANCSRDNQQSQQYFASGQYEQQQQQSNSRDEAVLCENSTSSRNCENKDRTACDK